MPKFCRHGTLTERCPICHAEAEDRARTTSAPARAGSAARRANGASKPRGGGDARGRLVVRREARAVDDGYRSPLAAGLRATTDAERLAVEIGFAVGRLNELERDPPGLYAEIAAEPDLEEATWLAFLVAYLGPLEEADPFASIEDVRTPWGTLPQLERAELGPRTAHDPQRGSATLDAYMRFIERAGSQALAIAADPAWSPAQRFERAHERLALPGLHGRARYDLLVTLGALGRYDLAASGLAVADTNPVAMAAKRVFGIGDRITLDRRARDLAQAAEVPVASLDLALENWARPERITQGVPDAADPHAEARARAALGG